VANLKTLKRIGRGVQWGNVCYKYGGERLKVFLNPSGLHYVFNKKEVWAPLDPTQIHMHV